MSKESFLSKLKELQYHTFTLPVLQEEVKYKKLDVIESSIHGQLPNFISNRVLETMKASIHGNLDDTDQQPEIDNQDVKDILVKATEMFERNVIEPQLTSEEIVQIPSEDRIAWFMEAISKSYTSRTTAGGEVNAAEAVTFPDERTNKRNSKRGSTS